MPLSRQSSLQSPLVPMNVDAYPQLAPKPLTKRPLPRFDMDLKELFPDDLEMNLRPSQSFPQSFQGMQRMHSPAQTQPNQRQVQFQSMTQPHHPSSQRQQLPGLSSINSQIDSGLGLGGTQPPGGATSARQFDQQPQQQQPFYMQNTYNPDFMSSLPGMDFLNNAMGGELARRMMISILIPTGWTWVSAWGWTCNMTGQMASSTTCLMGSSLVIMLFRTEPGTALVVTEVSKRKAVENGLGSEIETQEVMIDEQKKG